MERLTVPGNLDSLDEIGKFVIRIAGAAGLDSRATYRLRLAVDELATNVITYGYERSGMSGDVDICGEIDDKNLTVLIEDTAVPYDPTETPSPDDFDVPLEDRPIGGLGVFLARQAVDEFRYEHVDGHNRSILVLRRPVAE
jgi:serine/threonine-protein kinase RsbW